MPDMPRHSAPQHDTTQERHTLTVREVEALFATAGVQRSHRHVLRLCQSGTLDAVKIPGGPSGEEWYVAPASVPKAIGDLKQIDEQRARRGVTQPDAARHGALEHDTKDNDAPEKSPEINTDAAGHGAPQPAVSVPQQSERPTLTEPAVARHTTPEHDIYEHPYVKKLERDIDKLEHRYERLEGKYEQQIKETQSIMTRANEQLVDLQKASQVAQSSILAEYLLRAKDFLLGAKTDTVDDGIDHETAAS